jgi:hypothetical protein
MIQMTRSFRPFLADGACWKATNIRSVQNALKLNSSLAPLCVTACTPCDAFPHAPIDAGKNHPSVLDVEQSTMQIERKQEH